MMSETNGMCPIGSSHDHFVSWDDAIKKLGGYSGLIEEVSGFLRWIVKQPEFENLYERYDKQGVPDDKE